LNNASYLRKVGALTRVIGRTEADRVARAREKANRRIAYVKTASFADELTTFVYKEAVRLRKQRNATLPIPWEIDHIVPFKGKIVSGLHIWSNIRVIPRSENAKKGNKYVPLYD